MNPIFPLSQEPDSIAMAVYESLLGQRLPESHLPWVDDIFIPGHPCHDAYSQMLQACDRLYARLGSVRDDPDTEIIVQSLLTYSKILALEMFRYGIISGKQEV